MRAPYLHNGSVPTLADLLKEPPRNPKDLPKDLTKRPPDFYRGDDAYDPANVGFRSDRDRSDDRRKLFKYETSVPGNAHTGHLYGTKLSEEEKKASGIPQNVVDEYGPKSGASSRRRLIWMA